MKNYNPITDDLFYAVNIIDKDGKPLIVSDLSAFKIHAYTTDEVNNYVELSADDIVDTTLYIPTGKLAELNPGPLRFKFFIGTPDSNFPDSVYNTTHLALTGYFVKYKDKK